MPPLSSFLRRVPQRATPVFEPLRITLARRLVETQGAPFVPIEEVFTDGASARDELGLLPAAQGPTVVRVRVEGGTASEQKSLAGDWFVDPDGGGPVARLPKPWWSYDNEANRWARARPLLETWETCSNAAWMLHAAGQAGIARPPLVLAACACARTALPFVPAGQVTPLRAIEAAERWARGETTLDQVRSAVDAVNSAASNWKAAAQTAAQAAAWAAYAAHANSAAASAAAWAANVNAAADATRVVAMARCADLVRREIPTLVVLRTVATLEHPGGTLGP